MNEDVDESKPKLFCCTVTNCSAKFTKNRKLVNHIRKHTGERPFVCNEPNCLKSYTNSSHLLRHKKTHTPTSEKIPCKYEGCHLELGNKYSLKKHYNRMHNVDRQYRFTCTECKKGFHKRRMLQQHSYLHTGQLPFICDVCNTRFRTLTDCNRHKRTHTSYACQCGLKFERWSGLLSHRKVCEMMKPKCSICHETFSDKRNLKLHLLIHEETGRRYVYPCNKKNCSRFYFHKKNLVYHIDHFHNKLALKQIPCTVPGCKKTFSKMQHLQQHVNSQVHKSKVKKTRNVRKDKGIPGKCIAAQLSGLELPPRIHKAIIEGKGVEILNLNKHQATSVSDKNRLRENCNNTLYTVEVH